MGGVQRIMNHQKYEKIYDFFGGGNNDGPSTSAVTEPFCVFQVWLLQHALHRLPHQRRGHFYDGSGPLLVPRHHGIAAPGAHWILVMGECQLMAQLMSVVQDEYRTVVMHPVLFVCSRLTVSWRALWCLKEVRYKNNYYRRLMMFWQRSVF